MSWTDFTALLVLASAMSFTPGPNTTLSAALGANGGLRHAAPFVLAVPLGWGLLLSASTLGVGAVLTAAPALALVLKGLGVAYVLWLAYRLSGSRAWGRTGNTPAPLRVTFGQGVALQFVNIKAWMAALSVTAGWLAGHADMGQRFLVVLPTMVLLGFLSNLSYALLGAALRGWLQRGARLLWFNRGMAALLVATAVWMLGL